MLAALLPQLCMHWPKGHPSRKKKAQWKRFHWAHILRIEQDARCSSHYSLFTAHNSLNY